MYCTLDDLLAECPEETLVQLTDDEGAGTIDTARIATALQSAATIVDSYIPTKYRTDLGQPGAPIPPLLIELTRDIALYKLYIRRAAPPERIEKTHSQAISTLKHIANGTIRLDQGEEPLAATSGAVVVRKPERLFGRDDMAGF